MHCNSYFHLLELNYISQTKIALVQKRLGLTLVNESIVHKYFRKRCHMNNHKQNRAINVKKLKDYQL